GATVRSGWKAATKTVLHNHHLLPTQWKNDFIRMGFKSEELNKLLTWKLPMNLHISSPNGVHAKTINWNKQWGDWIRETPKKDLTKANALNQLEAMVKNYKGHFTPEGVEEIMKKIDQLR
ncbi:MAG: hypothetical protein AAB267_06395, partial [Candidatus Desantisbacteria bacterium]